jgi:hypothetical protein
MSALGQKRTFAVQNGMSALPLKADMCGATRHVRFVPIADTVPTLLDNLIGALLERQGHIEAERLRSLEVDHKLELSWLQNW